MIHISTLYFILALIGAAIVGALLLCVIILYSAHLEFKNNKNMAKKRKHFTTKNTLKRPPVTRLAEYSRDKQDLYFYGIKK